MNKERRQNLCSAISLLNEAQAKIDTAKDIVGYCCDEEQECFDNLPESIQCGDRGDNMQENISKMEEVNGELDYIFDSLEEQISGIQEVVNG